MRHTLCRIVIVIALFLYPVLSSARPASADPVGDLFTWVNVVRANVNVPALSSDPTMNAVAQQWADHMAATGILAHNPSEATQVPGGWTKMGENIATAYNLTAAFTALVNSPDHYLNMVDPIYNRTGVGVVTDVRGQVWVTQDFGAYPPPAPAVLNFPPSGASIFALPSTFSWTSIPGAQYYCLTVGTSRGGLDLVNSGLLPANLLSFAVPALPGGPLWARLYSYTQGTWVYSDSGFTVAGPSTATFSRPSNGAVNVDTTQPFSWTPLAAASYYGLTVGTSEGGYDLVSTGPLPATQTSYAVPALPAGVVLWARLYSYIAGSWNHYEDISFSTAAR